jgi:hypothetical protein
MALSLDFLRLLGVRTNRLRSTVRAGAVAQRPRRGREDQLNLLSVPLCGTMKAP